MQSMTTTVEDFLSVQDKILNTNHEETETKSKEIVKEEKALLNGLAFHGRFVTDTILYFYLPLIK